jgi:hypothetical protein
MLIRSKNRYKYSIPFSSQIILSDWIEDMTDEYPPIIAGKILNSPGMLHDHPPDETDSACMQDANYLE